MSRDTEDAVTNAMIAANAFGRGLTQDDYIDFLETLIEELRMELQGARVCKEKND